MYANLTPQLSIHLFWNSHISAYQNQHVAELWYFDGAHDIHLVHRQTNMSMSQMLPSTSIFVFMLYHLPVTVNN